MSRRSDMTQLSERRRDAGRSAPAQPPARGAAATPQPPARAAAVSPVPPPRGAAAAPQPPARGAAAAPSRPAGTSTPSDVAQGLRDSLTATDEGLRRFLEMLQQSGLTEAVHGYRAMQMVLVQQRLWAHANGRSELLPLFQSLARTAEELHHIFAGFAGVMLPLKELDKLTRMTGLTEDAEAAAQPEAAAALEAVATASAPDLSAPDLSAPADDHPATAATSSGGGTYSASTSRSRHDLEEVP